MDIMPRMPHRSSDAPRSPGRPRGTGTAVRVLELAAELEAELVRRRLSPGDRFLSVREVAAAHQVRRDVINKALQVLARRGLIERKPRMGAIVRDSAAQQVSLAQVHWVTQEDWSETESRDATPVVLGLQRRLGGCPVRTLTLSGAMLESKLGALLAAACRARRPEGFVLIRCGLVVQRRVAASGLPVVVHGSVWPGVPLPWINLDNEAAGRLHAEALWARGVRRILLIRRDRLVPGEALFARGVRAALAERGAKADAVDHMELPSVPEVVRAALAEWPPSGRMAVIAATRVLADAARSVLPAAVPVHVGVVSGGPDETGCPYPHVTEGISPESEGELLAEAMLASLRPAAAPAVQRLLSVRLAVPGAGRG